MTCREFLKIRIKHKNSQVYTKIVKYISFATFSFVFIYSVSNNKFLRKNVRSADIITVCHDKFKLCNAYTGTLELHCSRPQRQNHGMRGQVNLKLINTSSEPKKLAKNGMDRYPRDCLWRLLTKSTRFKLIKPRSRKARGTMFDSLSSSETSSSV